MQTTEQNRNMHLAHQQVLLELLVEFDRVCRVLEIPYVLFAGTLLGAARHQGFIPWDDDVDVLMLREDYDRFLKEAEGVLDREKFFLQKEFSDHWPLFFSKLRRNGTACLEKFHPRDPELHQGIYMDIFPCDRAAKTAPGRYFQFLASKVVIAKALDARGYDTDSLGKKLFMALCRLMPGKLFRALAVSSRRTGMRHSFFGAASCYGKNVWEEALFTRRSTLVFDGKPCPVPENYDEVLTRLYGPWRELPPEPERVVKQHAILVDPDHSWREYAHFRDGMQFDTYTRSIR